MKRGVFVKIGESNNVERRRHELRFVDPLTGVSPRRKKDRVDSLVVLAVMKDGAFFERTMHRQLRQHRVCGEWYDTHVLTTIEAALAKGISFALIVQALSVEHGPKNLAHVESFAATYLRISAL
jgi:hypothetical protein